MGQKGCIKCRSRDASKKEATMTGTGLSKMFDIQANQFLVVYCTHCGYSGVSQQKSSAGSNVLDLFFGGYPLLSPLY